MEEHLLRELLMDFIRFCDQLLLEGKIAENQYEQMVVQKKEFLDNYQTLIDSKCYKNSKFMVDF
ncbi:hypothetical protein [Geosporobacter ferrireducens]|uniref:Uncharacterized protein n=1 Tax=Geosporobacter ferrireducens TaxID=1424294 RepID=A0A1D8GD72_9FIRM|nr:hypothetical protein [Geosporobacter ferrireducens]AOT68858.1 hypothetical protein Gferi_04385 [Geosporobacter ferrireducens]MTI54909.1 hypothetical protein [Geosporobacter ferrireducens]